MEVSEEDVKNNENFSKEEIDVLLDCITKSFNGVFLDDDFEVTLWRPCLRKIFNNYGNKVLRHNIRNELKFIKNILI